MNCHYIPFETGHLQAHEASNFGEEKRIAVFAMISLNSLALLQCERWCEIAEQQ